MPLDIIEKETSGDKITSPSSVTNKANDDKTKDLDSIVLNKNNRAANTKMERDYIIPKEASVKTIADRKTKPVISLVVVVSVALIILSILGLTVLFVKKQKKQKRL